MSKRVLLCIIAFASPFFFPWPFVLVLGSIASYFYPWVGVVLGSTEDLLYAPSLQYHNGFFVGLLVSGTMLGVRHFVKTRIMES